MGQENNNLTQKSFAEKLAGLRDFFLAPPKSLDLNALRKTLRRLILIRVLILTAIFGITLWNLGIEESNSKYISLVSWLMIATAVASIVNFLLVQFTNKLRLIGYLQLILDVALTTLAIYVTSSPMTISLYLLVIIGSGVVFGSHGATIIAALSSAAYATLTQGLIAPLRSDEIPLETQDVLIVYLSFVVIALISSYVAKRFEAIGKVVMDHQKSIVDLDQQQKKLIEDLSEGIIATDNELSITRINNAAKTILGLREIDAEMFLGRKLPGLFEHCELELPIDFFSSLKESDSTLEIDVLNRSRGTELQIRYQFRSVQDSEGNNTGKIFIFNDISHIRNIEERLHLHEKMTSLLSQKAPSSSSLKTISQRVKMIGESEIMNKIFGLVEKVSATDASVLITGESGTGKELIAKAIHLNSNRSTRSFVAVNCGAIPEGLIESELFGHKKGSFTGAVSDNLGLFRQANGGTIFLDEIGDLPIHLQTKLLRVLQEKRIRAVGDTLDYSVDVRVISATNRNLKKDIQENRFREDLFYRLNVVHVPVPPLRERREDIPILVRHFIEQFSINKEELPKISPEALHALSSYRYPGNIRELENIIERALVLDNNAILLPNLPREVLAAGNNNDSKNDRKILNNETEIVQLPIDLESELAGLERELLCKALEQSGGIKKKAAELLGLNFRSFRYRLKKYDLGLDSDNENETETEFEIGFNR
jgi:PAS domain S-box-containing protein